MKTKGTTVAFQAARIRIKHIVGICTALFLFVSGRVVSIPVAYGGYCSESTNISCTNDGQCPGETRACSNTGMECAGDTDCLGGGTCTNSMSAGNTCSANSDCEVSHPYGTCSTYTVNAGADCTSQDPDVVCGGWTAAHQPWMSPNKCIGHHIVDQEGVCDIIPDGTCDLSTPSEFCVLPVNGACASHPYSYVAQPGSNTGNGCTAGTYTDMSDTAGSRRRQCVGQNGGTTATCSATKGTACEVWVEGENTTTRGSYRTTTTVAGASNGQVIDNTNSPQEFSSYPSSTSAHATYTFGLNATGTYYVRARISAPNVGDRKVRVKVNSATPSAYSISPYNGTYNRQIVATATLNAGNNTLTFAVNDDAIKIDKLTVLNNPATTPTGTGGAGNSCYNPYTVYTCESNGTWSLTTPNGCPSVTYSSGGTYASTQSVCASTAPANGTCVVCGDGTREGAEVCDDGNGSNTDACLTSCTAPACGDGYVQAGVEQCDGAGAAQCGVGNLCTSCACVDTTPHNTYVCSTNGAWNLQTASNCATINYSSTGAYSSSATVCNSATPASATCVRCGDAEQDTNEICDDGNAANTDSCLTNCTAPACGDGYIRAGVEQCDDGNAVNTDGCLNNCTIPGCGDGFVQVGIEQCDDGNTSNTDVCLNTCITAACGDGTVRAGVEQCDDGNGANTDACLNTCVPSACGDGFIRSGVEQCDSGSGNSNTSVNACRTTCLLPSCGDGVTDSGEACDDGDENGETGKCDVLCEGIVGGVCGNDVREASEECDGQVGCDVTTCLRQEATCTLKDALGASSSASYVIGQQITFELTYPGSSDFHITRLDFDNGKDAESAATVTTAYATAGIYDVAFTVLNKGVTAAQGTELYDRVRKTCSMQITIVQPVCGNGVVNAGEECGEPGLNCSAEMLCNPYTCQCQNTCEEVVRDIQEECDDGNLASGDGCSDACIMEYCGDGQIDTDGVNNLSGDADDEICDAGANNGIEGSGCTRRCKLPGCGDGVIGSGEQCDGGSRCAGSLINCTDNPTMCPGGLSECMPRSRAGCSDSCEIVAACGDGLVQEEGEDGILGTPDDEDCDDGNTITTDACDTYGSTAGSNGDCTSTFCGDGQRQFPNGFLGYEQCDDGNSNENDGCDTTCKVAGSTFDGECAEQDAEDFYSASGAGVLTPNINALCAVGSPVDLLYDTNQTVRTWLCLGAGTGSSASCSLNTWYCGDSYLDPSEECDDGNQNDGDGCDSACDIEPILEAYAEYSGQCISDVLPTTQPDEILPIWLQMMENDLVIDNTASCAELEAQNQQGIPSESVICHFEVVHGEGVADGGMLSAPCLTEPEDLSQGAAFMTDAMADYDVVGIKRTRVVGAFFEENIADRITDSVSGQEVYGQYALRLKKIDYTYCGRQRATQQNPVPGYTSVDGSYESATPICYAPFSVSPGYFVQKGPALAESPNSDMGNIASLSGEAMIIQGTPWDEELSVMSTYQGEGKDYLMNEFVGDYEKKAVITEIVSIDNVARTFKKVPNQRIWMYTPPAISSYFQYDGVLTTSERYTNLVMNETDIETLVDDAEEPFTLIVKGSNIIFKGNVSGKGLFLVERDVFFSAFGDVSNCDDTETIQGLFVIFGNGKYKTSRVRNDSTAAPFYCKGGNMVIKGTLVGALGTSFESNRRSVLNAREPTSYLFSSEFVGMADGASGSIADGEAEICTNNEDDDRDGRIDCTDMDCASAVNCILPERDDEICTDNIDNDGDMVIDCADNDCFAAENCQDTTLPAENCENNIDDNANGYIDCADAQCLNSEGCETQTTLPETNCTDNVDNDGNGQKDCADAACENAVHCGIPTAPNEICTDNIDNDGDRAVDCADTNCVNAENCKLPVYPSEVCTNGQDDNGDGKVDCTDPQCNNAPTCQADVSPVSETTCTDNIDNDNDGKIDCADTDCVGVAGCILITPMAPTEVCDDGVDNDLDGKIDCADTVGTSSNCAGVAHCQAAATGGTVAGSCTSSVQCNDGNDGNGIEYCDLTQQTCKSVAPSLIPKVGLGMFEYCYKPFIINQMETAYGASVTTPNPQKDPKCNEDLDNTTVPFTGSFASYSHLSGGVTSGVNARLTEFRAMFQELNYAKIDYELKKHNRTFNTNQYNRMKRNTSAKFSQALGLFEYCYRSKLEYNLSVFYQGGTPPIVGPTGANCNVDSNIINSWPNQQVLPSDHTNPQIVSDIKTFRNKFMNFNDVGDLKTLLQNTRITLDLTHEKFITNLSTHPQYWTEVGSYCTNGLDDDLDGTIDASDSNCSGQTTIEICFNGIDDDGDSAVDCADSQCSSGIASCTFSAAPAETNCTDDVDNDSDGKADCSDGDCKLAAACTTATICNGNGICEGIETTASCSSDCEICSNTQGGGAAADDSDQDTLANCADPECAYDSHCTYNPGASCGNGVCEAGEPGVCGSDCEACSALGQDTDGDGKVTCSDPDCEGKSICLVSICGNDICDDGEMATCSGDCETSCSDVDGSGNPKNNDGDLYANCADPDCKGDAACTLGSSCGNAVCEAREDAASCSSDCEQCDDGVENVTDADAYYDCAEPSCSSAEACTDAGSCGNGLCESGETSVSCANDCEICDDGVENPDTDTYKDCADRECATDAACQSSESSCGNAICEAHETAANCAADCEICDNGIDDDGDSYIDCADTECGESSACEVDTVCNENGICETGETYAGCSSDCESCSDGVDNADLDSYVDCADAECSGAAVCRIAIQMTQGEAQAVKESRTATLIEGSSLRLEAAPELWTEQAPGLADFLRYVEVLKE